ncbi:MAG: Isoquinoline 1-oxidoreductase [Gammaproteobacteria bacterium]|nr:Isoquinoline 1-oxidoreductase [Gammaproteobacteria bacterium]
MNRASALSRRDFIAATLTAGGAVLFYRDADSRPAAKASPTAVLLDGWIRIAPGGTVTVFSRTTELGQGALTSLAMIVAEELVLDPASIIVEMAPVTDTFMDHGNTLGYGVGAAYYATWGSLSSRDMDRNMRKIAATARVLLLRAAAQRWSVAETECSAEKGRVRHTGGRTVSYAELAPTAASLPVPQDIEPTPRARWCRLGRSTARFDIPSKTDGSAIYGVDVQRPGMLVATIAQCPMFGGRLESVDTSAAETMPGVKKVLTLGDAVAVIASGYWPAKQALARLRPIWRAGERKAADSAAQYALLRRAVQSPDHLFVPEGAHATELLAAHSTGMTAASSHLEALYDAPFLAHAPMEPMNATAHVTPRGAELWVPTQYQSMVRDVVAELLGLPRDKVIVHTTMVGGGFGRRTEIDYAIQAAQIARHVEQPIKLIWSREEDTSRGYFRPMAVMQLRAGLDERGQPTAFSFTAACPSIMDYSIERRNGAPREEIEEAGLANARDLPYALPAQKIALASTDLGVPLTWMRSVGSQASVFGLECFLDEMAAAAKTDPVTYRRHLLRERPRELAVVEKLASLAAWDQPVAAGRHRGFALNAANGSVVAQVIELEVSPQRAVRLHRVYCVVDCGVAFNPDAVVAQMEGGIIFGLTGALLGEISLEDGAVLQKNFDSYPLLTLAQTPTIEVSILQSDAPVGGVGEEAVPPVAPAVANALFSATGVRLRSLPLMRQGFTLASAI